MRSPLPTLLPRGPSLAARAAALPALLLALAGPAAALDIGVAPPHERGGFVWVDVSLGQLFSERVAGSLSRGMPAPLTLRAELWRRRAGWFDRLEHGYEVTLRLRYDFHVDAYRIERAGARPMVVSSLDSVAVVLSRPLSLPAVRLDALAPDPRYYVAVTATLKPLSVEDVEEVEGWLSGESPGDGQEARPLGFITGLPRSMFDAARNLAGLGDEHARAATEEFGLRDLLTASR